MLDRSKLTKQLEQIVKSSSDALFNELAIAKQIWHKILRTARAEQRRSIRADSDDMEEQKASILPNWLEDLDTNIPVDPLQVAYTIISVDGSQIYPDRHQGTDCFLINISEIVLHYGQERSGARLDSFPYVFAADEGLDFEQWVNFKRQELELLHGFELAYKIKDKVNNPLVLMFDGSLIFHQLNSKEEKIKQDFFTKYISILNACAKENIILCSYISLPKSKDLISLIRFQIGDDKLFSYVTDADLIQSFLSIYSRSAIFISNAEVAKYYPEQLKPHFFYLNIDAEVVRIEMPAYVVADSTNLQIVIQAVMDQIKKGNGYPVALSEAHEQAVVKSYEREMFYSLIKSMNFNSIKVSNKLVSKNRPAI